MQRQSRKNFKLIILTESTLINRPLVKTFSLCSPTRIHVQLSNLRLLQIYLVKCVTKIKRQTSGQCN